MSATIDTLSPLRLNSGQLTLFGGAAKGSLAGGAQAYDRKISVLLWQPPQAIQVDSLLKLNDQPFWVEAADSLTLHFCRVQRLTLRALDENRFSHKMSNLPMVFALNTG